MQEGSRVRLRPYNTADFRLHHYLHKLKFPGVLSLSEHPERTSMSYRWPEPNSYISEEGISGYLRRVEDVLQPNFRAHWGGCVCNALRQEERHPARTLIN